jgi:hypothetical protein
VGAPVGTTGIIACSRPADPGVSPSPHATRFHGSIDAGYTFTNLTFFGPDDVSLWKISVLYESDFLLSKRVALSLGAGSLVAGELDEKGVRRELGPGWLGAFSATFRVLDDVGAAPFIFLSTSVAATGTETRQSPTDQPGVRGSFTAIDFRFGATLGKTFADIVSPYISVRVFGGPVLWQERGSTELGTDVYHFQPAAGLAFLLPANLDLFIEAMPYFERGANFGIGIHD